MIDSFYEMSETENLHAFGGVILKCLTYEPNESQQGKDLSGLVQFLGRQVGSGKFSLRYISHGDGEVCVCLLFRAVKINGTNTESHTHQLLKGLNNYVQTQYRNYEFVTAPEIEKVLRPFRIGAMAEISRGVARVSATKWNVKNRQEIGFLKSQIREVIGEQNEDKETIDYVVPWIRPVSSLRGLCETLASQPRSCMVDFGITPLTPTEATQVLMNHEKNLLQCENLLRYEQMQPEGGIPTSKIKIVHDWINKQKSLMEIPGNIYFLRVRVASEEPISPELVQAVGEAVTVPAQSIANQIPLVSGGFIVDDVNVEDYLSSINELEKEKISEKLTQYLFDGGSLGAALVLPVADRIVFPGIEVRPFRFLEAPTKLPESGILFGSATRLRNKIQVRLKPDDLRYGVYITGEPGTGKTTVNETAIMDIIRKGHGVAILDPHGDLISKLIDQIPEKRQKDVILFDVADTNYPIGLNLLEWETENERLFVMHEMLSYMNMQFLRVEQGPMFWSFLRNSLNLITSNKKDPGTLLHIPMLIDPQYRQRWLDHVQDRETRFYFEKVLPDMINSRDGGYISYLTSKFESFTSDRILRNIIGQRRCTIRFEDVLNGRKILLARIAKGVITEQNASLLCMIFVARFWAAAIKRISVPLQERKDFYIFVDEFQNVATDTFISALAEARKFRLNLILSHQYTGQLPERVLEAVLGNVGTIMTFRSGPEDAQRLRTYFEPTISALALSSQPNYHAYVRLMIDGIATPPFSMRTALETPSLVESQTDVREWIVTNSRKLYGRPLSEVEKEIAAVTC